MSPTVTEPPAELEPLLQVVVMLGVHPVIDWTGDQSKAPAFALAMHRRFPSLSVKVRPAPVGAP